MLLKNGTVSIALPYGSWTLYSAASATGTRSVIPAANLGPVDKLLTIIGGGTTVTLDPRVAK